MTISIGRFALKENGLTKRERKEYEEEKSKTNESHIYEIFKNLSYEDARLLDVGCGKGVALKEAVKFPFKIVAGIEIQPELMQVAKRNFKIMGIGNQITCMEVDALDFEQYGEYNVFSFLIHLQRKSFKKSWIKFTKGGSLMDLNETTKAITNRHPWELSRTKCVLDEMSRFLGNSIEKAVYINAGAGDLYFDRALLKKYKKHHLHAIDIAYVDLESDDDRINKYHYFEEIDLKQIDYAIMMDSLEYMEDDVAYIKKMSGKIRKGGYFFFTLPAFPFLFSDYDINIKNLRRYSRKTFTDVLGKVPELEKVNEYYFYTSLFIIRFIQKMFHFPIDPEHKFTANWDYSESSVITRFLTGLLDLDFRFNRVLGKFGVFLPGLSMIVICKKV